MNAVRRSLKAVRFPLNTVRFPRKTVRFPRKIVRFPLKPVRFLQRVVCRSRKSVRCSQKDARRLRKSVRRPRKDARRSGKPGRRSPRRLHWPRRSVRRANGVSGANIQGVRTCISPCKAAFEWRGEVKDVTNLCGSCILARRLQPLWPDLCLYTTTADG